MSSNPSRSLSVLLVALALLVGALCWLAPTSSAPHDRPHSQAAPVEIAGAPPATELDAEPEVARKPLSVTGAAEAARMQVRKVLDVLTPGAAKPVVHEVRVVLGGSGRPLAYRSTFTPSA